MKSWSKKKKVFIRNPKSTRPWQHVLDPLSGYLILAEKLFSDGFDYAEPWNFGPEDEDCKSVNTLQKKSLNIGAKIPNGRSIKMNIFMRPDY